MNLTSPHRPIELLHFISVCVWCFICRKTFHLSRNTAFSAIYESDNKFMFVSGPDPKKSLYINIFQINGEKSDFGNRVKAKIANQSNYSHRKLKAFVAGIPPSFILVPLVSLLGHMHYTSMYRRIRARAYNLFMFVLLAFRVWLFSTRQVKVEFEVFRFQCSVFLRLCNMHFPVNFSQLHLIHSIAINLPIGLLLLTEYRPLYYLYGIYTQQCR